MTTTRCLLWLALLLAQAPAAAQTVRADRVTLNAGPCVITSGSAAPNGSRIGNVCDTFIQTTSGAIWTKTSGTGTSSGWIATLAGTGTPGTLAVWTSPGAIGDSIIAQAGGVATITGSATITGTGTMNAAAITNNASIGGTATIGTEHVTGGSTIDAALGVGGNTTLGGYIGTASYASQVSGWRITSGGAADVRYLFTDELRAKLFTADAESVLAGSMRVTKSYSTVAQSFTCPAAGGTATLWVYDASTYGDAPVFQANDWVLIHLLTRASFGPFTIADCVGTVSAYADGSGANAGQQTWTFTRGAGANSGAMTGGTVVPVNQLVQDMGVSGNGYVELSAVDGANGVNAPYIQTNTWTTAPIGANTATMCRLGNLKGIWGNAADEYGLTCGRSVFDPTLPSVRLSNLAFQLRNVPFDIWNAGVQVFSIDATAPSLALGNPLPSSYAGGAAGFWMGKDTDGLYKVRIGDPVGNRLTYSAGGLSIVGNGSGITDINGGNITAGTITGAQINVTPAGAALNDDPNTATNGSWVDVAGHGLRANVTTISDGAVGTSSLRSPVGHSSYTGLVKRVPVDPQKSYRLHLWARASADASGQFAAGANAFDGAGNYINTLTWLGPTTVSSGWAVYNLATPPLQANVRVLQLFVSLNTVGNDLPAGWMEIQDFRFEEVLPSTLIKDGAITTAKVQAGAITANEIAANTITVGQLNATGFGDNLIKNSTFEGTLAGWSIDPVAASGGSISLGALGPRGPGNLVLAPTGSGGMLVDYFAVPVTAGQPYRIAFSAAPYSFAGQGLFLRIYESNSSSQVRYVRAGGGTFLPGDISPSSSTDPSTFPGLNLVGGWTPFEYTYTPPAGVNWVSLSFFNYTCVSGYGSGCQSLGIDGVEMQAQLGSGHIRAASLTADRLVANTITAAQIAAGTITSTQIAASTITGGNIAGGTITGGNIAGRTITAGALVANTITSNEIGVRAIVAGNIATGTLTANEIAAGTITGDRIAANTINSNNIQAGSITADRMAVTSLSAISANLGSITAGSLNAVTVTSSTINSPTINAACTTINSNGITLTPGQSSNCNWYKWNNGAGLYHDGGAWMGVSGASFRVDTPGGAGFLIDSNFNLNANSNINLNGYVTVASGRNLTVSNLSGSGNRLVCTNNNGTLYVSAANGSC